MAAKLVAIGDSLTQGFQHGAIRNTHWSYPAMVARALGAAPFKQGDFAGGGDGGPLLDIHHLAQILSDRFGAKLDLWDLPGAGFSIMQLMDRIEDHWERQAGAGPSATGPIHHNLAVWGFEVLDAITLSDGACLRNTPRPKDDVLAQLAEMAMYRTARRVLNPSQDAALEDLTQVEAAKAIAAREGGIENLLLALGANNALATCLRLEMRWSQSADFRKLPHQRNVTIWEAEHFRKIFDLVAAQVKEVDAECVFVATVPHVTIAPVARGTSPRARAAGRPERVGGFYEYYTHFWTWDSAFDPDEDRHITREDARAIDATIDEYNHHIERTADANDWKVIPFGKILDEMAFRRNDGKPPRPLPKGLVDALRQNPKTKKRVFADDKVLLDTRFFSVPSQDPPANTPFEKWQEEYRGGLFGLDGVHPTTIGYGVVAYEILRVMKDAGVPGADPATLDWTGIVAADKLVTEPPAILGSLRSTLDALFNKAKLGRVIEKISGVGSQP